jgi:2-polyprenyl-6-methoxyphenol hydroxylase-like FAD-dependent oxidoreductase/catechol 2,3-dioxygenase-like lactoylglutathione lyase family enzyme
MTAMDADVAIVGYGPVGQMLSALLGRAGHRVVVVERFKDIYRLPRAVHLDGEIMRLLQSLGVAETLAERMLPVPSYEWFGADGKPLVRFEAQGPASCGWSPDYLFFQPDLETALDRFARAQRGVTVERGWLAEGLVQHDAGAELAVRRLTEEEPGRITPTGETRMLCARWVVGADGANSMVREACGITRRDLGFDERWLVVDAEPYDMGALAHLPIAGQWCDPARPRTHVQSGVNRRRWEFMLLPDEKPSDFDDPERVWSLLRPWYTPQDGVLTRSAVYEFHSMLANQIRDGHVILVGDAAHLTPPFLGQGMCSGLRDAANVAWKLDLVLRALASEQLLGTIDAERQPHNEAVIRLAGELGRVLCELEPRRAAERDAKLREMGCPPSLSLPPLSAGVLHRGRGDNANPLAGALSVQGVVARAGEEGLFDDVVGQGFALIVAEGDPLAQLAREHRALVETLAMTVASLDPDAPHGVRDRSGHLTAWLYEHGAHAVVVRPDFYVFGTASSPEELPALLSDLRWQLNVQPTPAMSGATVMSDVKGVIHPKFHHVNLKTTRLQEMVDWYATLIGTEVTFQHEQGAWISNDKANHRIALLAFPGFVDDPEKETRTGLHHTAFEYDSFEDLNTSYLRLRQAGIVPDFCLDHGMTLSYYYRDPDGNRVELQVDCFADWAESTAWMRESPQFHNDPIGKFVDPDRVAAAVADGATFEQIHARAMAGELEPEHAPAQVPQVAA